MSDDGPDYRESHVDPGQVAWYEHGVYRQGSYDSLMWERQKRILHGIIGRHLEGRKIRFLDFACGTGRIISFLEPLVSEATGVDISQRMLDLARPKLAQARLVCGDITTDPSLVSGPFDLITAFRFVLNAEPPLREAALQRLAGLLADDGVLVFNVHGNAWSVRRASYLVRRYIRRQRINQLSPASVRALVARHGMEVVEMRGVGVLTSRLRAAAGATLGQTLDDALERSPRLQPYAVDVTFVARRRT